MPALLLLYREPLFHLLGEQNRFLGQAGDLLGKACAAGAAKSIREDLASLLNRDLELRNRLARRLCDVLITPIDHGDTMRLSTEIGGVLRDVASATRRLLDYGPPQGAVGELAGVVRQSCQALSRRYPHVPGKISAIEPFLELQSLRRKANRLATQALAASYASNDSLGSIWERDVIASLRSAAHHAKDAGDVLHRVALKNS